MRRGSMIWLLVGVPLIALVLWISSKTYWADVKLPMPPTGEALTNPFYAVQRFAEALGARTVRDRALTIPSTDSVIVLSAWHWNLGTSRREALQHWVESGGRLVVDRTLVGGDEFERWSRIVREYRDLDEVKESETAKFDDFCRKFQEEPDATPPSGSDPTHRICDADEYSFLTTVTNATWALREKSGTQAIRVQVGRGTVTVINASPFQYRSLFDGDHGWLFVAATQLRRGDDVHFLSEDDHPSLLSLIWQYGGPVVVLTLAIIALMLWRGSVRFGPLAAAPHSARRSLAEQIRGTGQFALRLGGYESLHAACVRALDEAARRRVPGYTHLSAKERGVALARITGFSQDALLAAIHHPAMRGSGELRNTIALLETARRRTLNEQTRSSHGTH